MNCFARSICLGMMAATTVSGSASAQSLREELAQKDVTQISEGLYVKRIDNNDSFSESYVAVGAAGQTALLAKLLQMRDERDAASTNDSDVTTRRSEPLDELIERLSAPTSAGPNPILAGTGGPFRGSCSGVDNTNNPSDPFYVQALAGGGPSGPGGASAGTWNYSASINSTNFAAATAIDSQGTVIGNQSVTTHGTTAAVVSQLYNNGCGGASSASVTCPGATSPAISAYAHGFSNRPGCIPN